MNRLTKLILILLSLFLVLTAIFSLPWRFQHDSPIMLYIAFLMDRFGYMPYRDIFDMNMPGTHLAYYLIGKLFGYTDIGIRSADLFTLAAILIVNWLLMKRISKRAAWSGSVFWGLLYLGLGPTMSLQREYLVLFPVITGVLVFTSAWADKPVLRNLAVGFFFGIAATIRPNAAIGFPLLLLFDFVNNNSASNNLMSRLRMFFRQTVLPAAAGFGVPLLGVFLYLWATGAITPFLDMATNYWPLYTHLTAGHTTMSGFTRLEYFLLMYCYLGNFYPWVVPASIGAYVALRRSTLKDTQRRQVLLLIGLAFCYSIYPVFAGQFWQYHWLLFGFFIVQLSSLCFIEETENAVRRTYLYVAVALVVVVSQTVPMNPFIDFLMGRGLPTPEDGRVDEIATFLKANLRAGDTVQSLDWTGGAVHAMLISEARIATPFIYDFHFYHHISNPYIQTLRRRFIADLRESQPRFIIQVFGEFKPWVAGKDTTRDFEELQLLLDEDYTIVTQGNGYHIYELRARRNNACIEFPQPEILRGTEPRPLRPLLALYR